MMKKILCLVLMLLALSSCTEKVSYTTAEQHLSSFNKIYEHEMALLEENFDKERTLYISPDSRSIWKEDPLIYETIDMNRDRYVRSIIFAVCYHESRYDSNTVFYNYKIVMENGEIVYKGYEALER